MSTTTKRPRRTRRTKPTSEVPAVIETEFPSSTGFADEVITNKKPTEYTLPSFYLTLTPPISADAYSTTTIRSRRTSKPRTTTEQSTLSSTIANESVSTRSDTIPIINLKLTPIENINSSANIDIKPTSEIISSLQQDFVSSTPVSSSSHSADTDSVTPYDLVQKEREIVSQVMRELSMSTLS